MDSLEIQEQSFAVYVSEMRKWALKRNPALSKVDDKSIVQFVELTFKPFGVASFLEELRVEGDYDSVMDYVEVNNEK